MTEKKVEHEFPITRHHESVKKELNAMAEAGKITYDEAAERYKKWLEARRSST